MTRIISGFAGSLSLVVPPSGTRPTSDRVREAIFSALQARDVIAGARVLDLYAGTGALGLEAASRGASHVTLVDKGSSAAAACRKNAAVVKKAAPRGTKVEIEVSGASVQSYLDSPKQPFDLVFLDPPYQLTEAELLANLESLVHRLSEDAVVLLERSSRDPEPEWPADLTLDKRKDYGDTALYWLSPTEHDDAVVTAE
ncbi:16S rRNA (guanine(966)-N(2))-methyltransferase RsmD [Glaciihabitans sp. dw_435]|uniref:16S rRNA (guanine(966)-N(2))-methyltransferase RsmD n=1 Tax=Glaciihabitans sp. dw_435 TaxID=2720081 RepID=UPI001BD5DEDE|nr:16S rRNA (guanine(966)-N(2))-methyltransferase RsmD [Glaciihabitans sp. dw_435]